MCGLPFLKKLGRHKLLNNSCAIFFSHMRNKENEEGCTERGRGTTNITMLSLQRIPRARVHKRRGQCKKKNKKPKRGLSGAFRSSTGKSRNNNTAEVTTKCSGLPRPKPNRAARPPSRRQSPSARVRRAGPP